MGFFSWRSIVSKKDIMNIYGSDHDGIALLLPDNTIIQGDYDGYGRITGIGDCEPFCIYEELMRKKKPVKVMLRSEVADHLLSGKEYKDYEESENAEGQGHWISSYNEVEEN